MAIRTTKQRIRTAAGYVTGIAEVSLHTADPGTAGDFEAAGGTYARVASGSWTDNLDGTFTSPLLEFDAPAGDYPYAGLWDAAGDFIDGCAISAVLTAQGVVRLTLTYTQG